MRFGLVGVSLLAPVLLWLSGCQGGTGTFKALGNKTRSDSRLDVKYVKGADGASAPERAAPGAKGEETAGTPTAAAFDLGTCTEGQLPSPRVWQLTRAQLAQTLQALNGVVPRELESLPPESYVHGYPNHAQTQRITGEHLRALLPTLESAGRTAAENALRTQTCLAQTPVTGACVEGALSTFLAKAWRRPAEPGELATYADFLAKNATAGTVGGLSFAFTRALLSPSFLFRSELGAPSAGGERKLTAYEVASSLSYLWLDGPPDAPLLVDAKSGRLLESAVFESHVRRLLTTPQARQKIRDFMTYWLELGSFAQISKDGTLFPEFTDALRGGLQNEFHAFVDEVVWGPGNGFAQLYDADFVMVNDTVARHYGLPAPASTTFRKQPATGSHRTGLLTLGAVLAGHASGTETAIVHRGRFVRERILCDELPAPPQANMMNVTEDERAGKTGRELWLMHSSQPECASCHKLIDPLGFAWEHYDPIGRYRAQEGTLPIDASGEIPVLGDAGGAFRDGVDFSRKLAGSEHAQQCFVTQFYTYAFGRPPRKADECDLARAYKSFRDGKDNFTEFFVALSRIRSFAGRSGL